MKDALSASLVILVISVIDTMLVLLVAWHLVIVQVDLSLLHMRDSVAGEGSFSFIGPSSLILTSLTCGRIGDLRMGW